MVAMVQISCPEMLMFKAYFTYAVLFADNDAVPTILFSIATSPQLTSVSEEATIVRRNRRSSHEGTFCVIICEYERTTSLGAQLVTGICRTIQLCRNGLITSWWLHNNLAEEDQ